jgi:DedD protein
MPVLTRTQRRLERRQMLLMVILVAAVTGASFFLGVMVGERGSANRQSEFTYPPAAQVAPPPPPPGSQRMTFYEDLPKGNAAPLGSGINLPKSSPVPSPAPPAVTATPVPATAPTPTVAAAAPAPMVPAVASPAPSPPPAAVAAAPPKTSAGGSMVVQVASTRDEAEAKRLVATLKSQGHAAYYERADLGAKGVWYRVTTGPYADRNAAEKAAVQLKQQKFSPMVRAR